MPLFSTTSDIEPYCELLEHKNWVHRHFKDYKIISFDSVKSNDGQPCIMNAPHITMDHPYLERHYLDTAIKSLDEVLKQKPDNRLKDLIVTVRGSGGGKTRMLEELRRATNDRDDAVAIGVTFNCDSLYEKRFETFLEEKNEEINIILSIIVRISCTIYGLSFSESLRFMSRISKTLMFDKFTIDELLRYFIQHVLIQMTEGGKEVKDFMLLIDEVMKVEDSTGSLAAAMSMLSRAMLNKAFVSSDGTPIHAALVVSSLTIPPHSITDSGRDIKSICLPPNLNAIDVLDKWWKVERFGLSTKDKFKLELLVKMFNNLPRQLQFAGDFLNELLINKYPRSRIDEAAIYAVMNYVKNKVFNLYGCSMGQSIITFDSKTAKYLYALIFSKDILMDPKSLKLIRYSIFTNSLERFYKSCRFIPEGSIVMLAALASNRESPVAKCLLRTFESLLDVIASPTGRQLGDALESACIHWLQMRIAVTMSGGEESIKLSELFAIKPTKDDHEIMLFNERNHWNEEILFPRLCEGNETFLAAFDAIQYSSQMFKSINGQQWDSMIMTYRRDGVNGEKKPFLIFIDFKSKSIIRRWKKVKCSTKELDLTQYQLVKKLVQELKSGDSDVRHPPTLQSQALIDGDYMYIYLTTYPLVKPKWSSNDYTEDISKGNLYITNEAEAKKFFGILFPFYQTVRAAINSTPRRFARKKSRIVDNVPK